MADKATIRFAYGPASASGIGRDLNPESDLAEFITQLRKSIGKTYNNGSLHVRLFHELPREAGQTILRNRRLITEKVEKRSKFLEGKVLDLSDMGSYGIEGDRFVLYLPNEVAHEDLHITIAQFPKEITPAQVDFLKRQVSRVSRLES